MQTAIDRNPYRHIPPATKQRTDAWTASARNLVSKSVPFLNLAVERLMFAERPILQMEARLAYRETAPVQNEPLLLMECSSLAMLWICGLNEVTRLMNPSESEVGNAHRTA